VMASTSPKTQRPSRVSLDFADAIFAFPISKLPKPRSKSVAVGANGPLTGQFHVGEEITRGCGTEIMGYDDSEQGNHDIGVSVTGSRHRDAI
jgi:hypothetical protein